MKFKSKLATIVSTLILAGSAYATQNTLVCPGVGAIQSEGLTMSGEIMTGLYLTYNLSNYNTEVNWVFMVGPVEAESEDESLEHSNELLSVLSGNPTPEEIEQDTWACDYNLGDDGIMAMAIHSDDMLSPQKMTRFLRRHH